MVNISIDYDHLMVKMIVLYDVKVFAWSHVCWSIGSPDLEENLEFKQKNNQSITTQWWIHDSNNLMHLEFIDNYHPVPSLSWSTWTSWSPSIIIHFHDDHYHHHHHHHEKPVDKKSGPFWSRLPVILGVEASRHDWLLPFWSDYLWLSLILDNLWSDYPWLSLSILDPW